MQRRTRICAGVLLATVLVSLVIFAVIDSRRYSPDVQTLPDGSVLEMAKVSLISEGGSFGFNYLSGHDWRDKISKYLLAKMVTGAKFRGDRSRGFLYLRALKFEPVTPFAEGILSAKLHKSYKPLAKSLVR